jgi:hypothetical protein
MLWSYRPWKHVRSTHCIAHDVVIAFYLHGGSWKHAGGNDILACFRRQWFRVPNMGVTYVA